MKFTLAFLVTLLAFAPAALASVVAIPGAETNNPNALIEKRDMHRQLFCVDYDRAKNLVEGGEVSEDNDATDNACAMYRRRNTGNKKWDKCPDCYIRVLKGSNIHVCISEGRHMGGDEMTYYCKKSGAHHGHT
ncbi:hypothetical protein HYFRA_00000659 [Hymenoscyphus fraxineus]|uniref:Uncharacterized protein n=1 Tax=Hymenoscyphus fraxineus TaxID=746836 RepID=A0A9N9L2J5_9HELO|nr:hypothetical protein HYFRA_00000659 [Hymenoscyphus fraxineus]